MKRAEPALSRKPWDMARESAARNRLAPPTASAARSTSGPRSALQVQEGALEPAGQVEGRCEWLNTGRAAVLLLYWCMIVAGSMQGCSAAAWHLPAVVQGQQVGAAAVGMITAAATRAHL
jgi:hypothetical protein